MNPLLQVEAITSGELVGDEVSGAAYHKRKERHRHIEGKRRHIIDDFMSMIRRRVRMIRLPP